MRKSPALAALLLAACNAEAEPPEIQVEDPWARSTAAGQTTTAAYFTIANRGGEDRLRGISSTAGQVSIHSTSMEDGVMRMRPLDVVEIPANSSVKLEPGAIHVMLTGLTKPLEDGATIPLELRFERSGERRVEVPVRPAASMEH